MGSVEHRHACVGEHAGDPVREAVVVVVVAQHRDDGRRGGAAGVGEHGGLLDEAVRRQVAREEHEVDVCQLGEDPYEAIAVVLGGMEVADGRNACSGHETGIPRR